MKLNESLKYIVVRKVLFPEIRHVFTVFYVCEHGREWNTFLFLTTEKIGRKCAFVLVF